ncbi:unnamed protein product, partial [Polarella glacialis]
SGGLGGSWAQLANQSSKVQIERGTYHLGMASGTACPQDMPNYAKRDEVLAHLQAFVQEHGLAEHCQFSAEVCEVRTDNNNINNNNNNNTNSYSISWKPPGGADVTPVWATGFGALMVLPGFLPRPRVVLLPQESVFQGTVAYGVSDDVPSSALVAPKRVAILGHGAFAVEHARTAAEAGAAGVAIICRRRNLVLPRVVSWLVDGAGDGTDVDVETMLSLVKPMYQLLGFSSVAEALPRSLMKNDRGRWVLTQSNPAISDVYFLLQAQGMLEVVVGAVEAVQPHNLLVQPLEGPEVSTKLHLREIPCDTLIKCLGWDHSAQADLGRALSMQSIHGFWLDGDPRRFLFKFSSSATNGASNMNTLSFFVLLKHAHAAFFHFLARPSALAAALHGLPVVSSLGEDFGATFVGQAFMAMARAVPELREAGREINRLKAERIRETHPVEDFVRDLAAEWAEYQQARLAPGVPAQVYPYSEATAAQFLAERQATAEAAAQGPGVANSQAEDGLERWLFLSAPRGLAKALRREGGTRVPAGGFLCLPGSPSDDSGWTTDEADAEEEELAQKQCLASWPFAERAEGVASDAEAAASASVAASAVVLLPPLGRGGLDEHRAALHELSAELTRQSAARTRSRSSRERVVVVVTTFGGRLPESAGPLWAFWEQLLGSNGRIAAGDEGSRPVLLDLATANGEVPTSTSTLALLLSQNLGRLLDDTMPHAAVRGDQLFAIQQTLQLRYLPGGVQSGSAPNSAAAPSFEALRDRVLAAAQSALGSGDDEEDQLLADTSLLDAGLDSLAQIDVRQALGRQLGPQASRLLTASVLFDHPTAESLARRLFEELFVSRQEAPAASLEPAAPQVLSLEPGSAMPVAEQQHRSDEQAQPGQEEAKEQAHCRTEVLVGSRRCGLLVPEAWQQQRPSRLLFLHGARADAEITARIMRATGWTRPQRNPVFEVALAEAPHEDKADPSLFEGAVRLGWYDPAGRYRQWLLPREELGTASQAEEDQRWSESVEVISEVWRSWGPFDGIAGLCEGAAAAAMAALTPGSLQPPPRFLLSVGGFASDRPQYQAAYGSPAGFPSLHIVGSEEGSSAQSFPELPAWAHPLRRRLSMPGAHALPELEADLEEEVRAFVASALGSCRGCPKPVMATTATTAATAATATTTATAAATTTAATTTATATATAATATPVAATATPALAVTSTSSSASSSTSAETTGSLRNPMLAPSQPLNPSAAPTATASSATATTHKNNNNNNNNNNNSWPPSGCCRLLRPARGTLAPSGSQRLVLLMLPHAGGNAAQYEEVAGELPAGELAVWLCEYPGHGALSEEDPLRSLRALVRAIYDELLALAALGAFGQLPLALFGHSMGSAVMVQLTEMLLSPGSFGLEAGPAASLKPLVLLASGRGPPHALDSRPRLHLMRPGSESFMSALEGLSLAFGTAYRERASNSPAVRDTADLLCADFAACFEEDPWPFPVGAPWPVAVAVLYGDRDPGCTMPAQSCRGVLVLPVAEVASMLVAELRAALPLLLAEPAVAEDNAPARAGPTGAAENAPDQAPLQQQAGFPTAAAAGGSTTAATTAATTDESGGKKQLLWLQQEVVRAIIRASPRTREQFKGLLEALGSSSSSSAESCNAQAGDEQVTEEEDEDKPSSRPKLLDTSFAELGFGSLEWMLIRESLSTSLGGVRVPPQLVFQGPTITSLSYLLLPLQAQPAGQPPQLFSQLQQPQTQTQLQPPTQPQQQQQQQPQQQQQQQQQQQNPLLEVNIPRGLAASQIGSNVRLGLNLRLEGPVVICDGAVVRDNVTLGGGCELGEFCMVGPQVELGPNCRVAPMGMVQNDVVLGFGCQVAERALLRGPLRAGNRCKFDEQSIIGGHSSHLNAVRHGQIQIGNNCTFEIGSVVLAPRGVHGAPGVTRIGDGVIVHMKAEVSHDCVLEDGVACNGELSGFCHIMKGGKVSKGTVLHQFTTVGTGAFLAMSRKVRLDVLPYCIFDEHSVLDRVSLGRNGVSPEEADELDAFYQRHFSSEAAQYCQSVEGLLPRSSDGEGFWFASELRRFFAIRAQMRDQRLLATFGVDESVHQLRRPSS